MDFASIRIITDDVDRLVRFYELVTCTTRPAPVFAEFRTGAGTLAIASPATVAISPEDEAEMSRLRAEAGSMEAANRAVGHLASARGNTLRERRRRVIQDRLPVHEWPAGRDLRIVAVDASTGKRMVFTTGSGVSLVEAVEASCAAPCVWPLARVGDHSYMDGGTWSLANVDVAVGADRVLVFAPITQGSHPGHSPAEDLAALGVQGLLVEPSPQSLRAFGTDSLDPQARPGAAEAGLAQAAHEAGRIASLM